MGAGKATVILAGRPLIAWPLDALRAVLGRVAVAAKPDTELPALPRAVEVWREPPIPRHPLSGILEALRRAGGEAVLVCAVDLPLVDAELVRVLAGARARGSLAVVASAAGRLQPLLARYEAASLEPLATVALDRPLTATVMALDPRVIEVDSTALLNVNDRAGLRRAERALAARS
jgi:molybdopterin-guanine dinucleotide biosynthesis protein A